MNEYGRLTMAYWQERRPQEYVRLTDPQAYFSQLGEEILAEIADRMWALAGDDLPGEGLLAKSGRLNAARLQAEDLVLVERLPA